MKLIFKTIILIGSVTIGSHGYSLRDAESTVLSVNDTAVYTVLGVFILAGGGSAGAVELSRGGGLNGSKIASDNSMDNSSEITLPNAPRPKKLDWARAERVAREARIFVRYQNCDCLEWKNVLGSFYNKARSPEAKVSAARQYLISYAKIRTQLRNK